MKINELYNVPRSFLYYRTRSAGSIRVELWKLQFRNATGSPDSGSKLDIVLYNTRVT